MDIEMMKEKKIKVETVKLTNKIHSVLKEKRIQKKRKKSD